MFVGVSTPRLAALSAAGQAPPALVPIRMLVDTGASNTNLCDSVIQKLSIAPTGAVQVHTPSTGNAPVAMDQYDVNLYINLPGLVHTIPTIPIICANFASQGIHGLIGRDILASTTLIYHGPLKIFTLNF